MKSSQKLEQTNHMMQPQHPTAHIQRTQLTIDTCTPVFTGALFRVSKLCTYAHAPQLACGGQKTVSWNHISLTFMWIPRANLGCRLEWQELYMLSHFTSPILAFLICVLGNGIFFCLQARIESVSLCLSLMSSLFVCLLNMVSVSVPLLSS